MSNLPLAIVRDHRVGRAQHAYAAGERAGIDPRQADLAFRRQPIAECALRTEIRRRGHFLAHHAAQRAFDRALDVLAVDPDIADVRESEGDDLRRVARIGHHFLIAGHRRVEADFADRAAFRAETPAPYRRAVGEHEDSRRAFGPKTTRLRRVRRGGVGHGEGAPKEGFQRLVLRGGRYTPALSGST